MSVVMQCEVCGAGGELARCSGCWQVWYCSKSCQKTHWRSHKRLCRPYSLRPVEGKGLGLVASRDIKLGEIIMREDPTLIIEENAPGLTQQFSRLEKSAQGEILKLHHDNPEDTVEERIKQIFLANAADIGHKTGAALYPTIPR